MTRRQIITLIGCSIFCMVILFTLYAVSPMKNDIYRASFTRKFTRDEHLKISSTLDLKFNSYYIAGIDKNSLYLGNYTAPLFLSEIKENSEIRHIPLKVELDSVREPNRFRTKVSPPYFYMSHGVKPIILRGRLNQWNANEVVSDNTDFFVEAVPTGSKSFALRAYSLQEKGYELAKKGVDTPFEFKFDLLQKQIDGLFDVDGQLLFNTETSTLVYLHYYKNQYLVMDTSLNLKFRGNTIDTFSHARIKIAKIKSEAQSMVSSPQMQLNQRGCLYKNLLLVQSNLLSATESAESFLINSIFDIYDISTGTYVKTLYIPDYKGNKVTDMLITDNKIITISGSHLVTYEHDEKTLVLTNH